MRNIENWDKEHSFFLGQAMQKLHALPFSSLLELVKDEQPQTLTLFCFQLSHSMRAKFLGQLNPELQVMVVARLARLKPVKPAALLYLYLGLLKKTGLNLSPEHPFFTALGLFKQLVPAQQKLVLNEVQQQKPELAQALMAEGFFDLYTLKNAQLQQLLANMPKADVAVLFKPLGAVMHQKLLTQIPTADQKWWQTALNGNPPASLKAWRAVYLKCFKTLSSKL